MPLPSRTLLAVAVGGATGSVLRWLVELWLPASEAGVPWATLLVNVLGSAALASLVVVLRSVEASGVRHGFLATGLLGGFTTFSTYAVQVAVLGRVAPAVALAYLVLTPVLCLAAAALASAVTRRRWRLA